MSVREILSDAAGNLSSKRTVTMLCVFLMIIGFFVTIFTSHKIPEYMWNTLSYIVMAGLGLTASERVTNFFTKISSTSEDTN